MLANVKLALILSAILSPAVLATPVPQIFSGGTPSGYRGTAGPDFACGSRPDGSSGCITGDRICGQSSFGYGCFGLSGITGGRDSGRNGYSGTWNWVSVPEPVQETEKPTEN